MRSDNFQLPCVQPPTSSYNLQLPHGCQDSSCDVVVLSCYLNILLSIDELTKVDITWPMTSCVVKLAKPTQVDQAYSSWRKLTELTKLTKLTKVDQVGKLTKVDQVDQRQQGAQRISCSEQAKPSLLLCNSNQCNTNDCKNKKVQRKLKVDINQVVA